MIPDTPGALFCILSARSVESHRKRVTKKDDRVSSAVDPAGLLLANLVCLLTQEDGARGKGMIPALVYPTSGCAVSSSNAALPPPLSPTLNPSSARGRAFVGWRTFRRTEIMKSETQGTYSRSPSPPPSPSMQDHLRPAVRPRVSSSEEIGKSPDDVSRRDDNGISRCSPRDLSIVFYHF